MTHLGIFSYENHSFPEHLQRIFYCINFHETCQKNWTEKNIFQKNYIFILILKSNNYIKHLKSKEFISGIHRDFEYLVLSYSFYLFIQCSDVYIWQITCLNIESIGLTFWRGKYTNYIKNVIICIWNENPKHVNMFLWMLYYSGEFNMIFTIKAFS